MEFSVEVMSWIIILFGTVRKKKKRLFWSSLICFPNITYFRLELSTAIKLLLFPVTWH